MYQMEYSPVIGWKIALFNGPSLNIQVIGIY